MYSDRIRDLYVMLPFPVPSSPRSPFRVSKTAVMDIHKIRANISTGKDPQLEFTTLCIIRQRISYTSQSEPHQYTKENIK